MQNQSRRQFGKQHNATQLTNTMKPAKSKRIIVITDKENQPSYANLPTIIDHKHTQELKPTNDPQLVLPYKEEIFQRMSQRETELYRRLIDPTFMVRQNEITEQHRIFIVDHLVKLCCQLRLRDESLFMAVEMMDAYLSKAYIKLHEFELLAITSLFISTKYEEIYPPTLERFLMRSPAMKVEVLNLEAKMLNLRNFDLVGNTTIAWLNIFYSQITEKRSEVYDLAKYILEITLLRTVFYQHRASEIALAAIVMAQKYLKIPDLSFNVADDLQIQDTLLRKLGIVFANVVSKPDLYLNKKHQQGSKIQMHITNITQ